MASLTAPGLGVRYAPGMRDDGHVRWSHLGRRPQVRLRGEPPLAAQRHGANVACRSWSAVVVNIYFRVTPTYVSTKVGGPGERCSSHARSEYRFGLVPRVVAGLGRPIQTNDERLQGRPTCPSRGHPTSAYANSEHKFGSARRVAAGLERPTQTTGECLQSRPRCLACGLPASIAGHAIAARSSCTWYSTIPIRGPMA